MIEAVGPGKVAMWICWAALALLGYLALGRAEPMRVVTFAATLAAVVAVAGAAAAFAASRGMHVATGAGWALALGALAGAGRALARTSAQSRSEGPRP